MSRQAHADPAVCAEMYNSYMSDFAVSDARNRFAEVIEQARRSGEPVYVTRRGQRVAAIVDADVLDRLVEAAEEADNRRELELARAEEYRRR
ncbi:MAG: type II toxin-antitoxin system Phd/YefM family antitoxin [Actinomycetota bacterium]|nr:type II toxin-antitoxin system Phd/YefM family antitoxin [Actinomycetota bacterium]